MEATRTGNQAQSNHQCLANHQAQASHHCLANHQAQASHHCLANHQAQASHHFLANHQAQVSHHFLVDHQAQVSHQYSIIKAVLCVLILQLLEQSNNLLKAEAEALGEVLKEELVEALGEVLALPVKLEEAVFSTLEVYQVSNLINQGLWKLQISTGRQKRTKTIGFGIYTNASGSQTFNVSVYIILFISYSTI